MDMKHVKYLALVLCIGNLSPVMAQTASKSLTVDNLVAWQRISGQAISDNGKWVACKYNPQIQISAESETKRSIFREKDKTKRSKKESAQHSKSRNKSFVMTSVSAL